MSENPSTMAWRYAVLGLLFLIERGVSPPMGPGTQATITVVACLFFLLALLFSVRSLLDLFRQS